jgi:O-antigen/teichoic acid export membrane protein
MLKRIAHAFFAFFFGQGIGVVASLLLVPLYLHVWSPALYGEWLALYSVVAYLSNLDFSVQTYAVNRLTQAYAKGDLNEYRIIQHTAFKFYLVVATIGTVAVVLLALLAPIKAWFNLAITSSGGVAWVVLLLGIYFLWTTPASFVTSIYSTTGNLAKTQWLVNTASAVSVGLTTVALVTSPKLPVLAAVQLVGFVFVVCWAVWDMTRHHPELKPGIRNSNMTLLGPMIRQSALFAIIDVGVGAGLQGSNLIVARLAGAAALALFVTTRTLANSIRQVINTIVHSASTDLTRLEALRDNERLRLAFRLVTFATTAGCVAISSSLWYEGASVLHAWTHGKLTPDNTLLRAFLTWLVLQSPWITASSIAQYTNKHRFVAFAFFTSNATALALSLLLIRRLGLAGIPISFVLSEAVVCYHWVIRDACRIVGQAYWSFALRLWTGLGFLAVLSLTATGIVHEIGGFGLFARWLVSGTVSGLVAMLGSYLFWFREAERKFVRDKGASGARYMGSLLIAKKVPEAA